MNRTALLSIIAAVVGVILLGLVMASIEIVDPGHNRVVVRFGSTRGTLNEGLHFIHPLSNTIDFDCRARAITLEDVSLPTQDQLKSTVDMTLKYRAISSMTEQMVSETGDLDQVVATHVVTKWRSLVREVSKTISTAEDMYNSVTQAQVQTEIKDRLALSVAPYGIEIIEIMMRDMRLPEIVQAGVNSKKQRAQEAERQKEELVRYKTEQEQLLARATAEKDAAEQEALQIRLLADAKAYEITVKNEAMANSPRYLQLMAMETLASISKDPSSKLYFLSGDSPNPLPLMHIGEN